MKDLDLDAFKAYDIRTKIGRMDEELQTRLFHAVGCYMKNSLSVQSVVICRDARLYVPQLAEGLSSTLLSYGIDVYLNPQPISTCQYYHTMMKHRQSAGVMLTASHNPGEYVGMKLMEPDLFPVAFGCGRDGGIAKIKQCYEKGERMSSFSRGKLHIINDLDSYIDYSLKLAGINEGDLKGQKILFEFLSGSAGNEVALAFQHAGADMEIRNIVPNGFFPQGDPNPIIEKSIAPARDAMRKGAFDFGFCFDGDGDRLDLMDADGNQIVPGYNMSILIPQINSIFKDAFHPFDPQYYADVKAIPAALVDMASKGVGVHIIRNGHSFIKAKLRANFSKQYLAAEEESAHYYMNFPYDPADPSKGCAAVESTLFFSLLTAKCHMLDPEAYRQAHEKEKSLFREREWPLHCDGHPEIMQGLMDEVENTMKAEGAEIIREMDDGSDLDAVLMRFNLPKVFDKNTSLGDNWIQVAERISRSEDAMVRWEVASNTHKGCEKMNSLIKKITDRYVADGYAHY